MLNLSFLPEMLAQDLSGKDCTNLSFLCPVFECQNDPVYVLVCVCVCVYTYVCVLTGYIHTNVSALSFSVLDVWEFKHLPTLSLDNNPELVGVI